MRAFIDNWFRSMKKERKTWGYTELGEFPGVVNPVYSDFRISIHMFGRRNEVILKRRENWDVPEDFVAGYREVFFIDDSKTEECFGAGIYVSNRNEK